MGKNVFFVFAFALLMAAVCAPVVGSISVVQAASVKRGQAAFVEGFDDLPLMARLAQEPGSVTEFDSPYGKIVESYASGKASAAEIKAFYAETLPQLGWAVGADGSFRREDEILTIEIVEKAGAATVRFQVAPPR